MANMRPNANLVIQGADPSSRLPKANEPTGEPVSLSNQISTMKMGDRYMRTKPDVVKRKAPEEASKGPRKKKIRGDITTMEFSATDVPEGAEEQVNEDGVNVQFDSEGSDDEGMVTHVIKERHEEDDDEGEEQKEGRALKTTHDDEAKPEDEDTLDPRRVDAYWIQREMGPLDENEAAEESQANAEKVFNILADTTLELNEVERKLVLLFKYNKFPFVQTLCKHRWKVVYCTKLARVEGDEERKRIEEEMEREDHLRPILHQLQSNTFKGRTTTDADTFKKKLKQQADEAATGIDPGLMGLGLPVNEDELKNRTILDLEALTFDQGGHFMSNKTCELPPGSFRQASKGYEEVHVPAIKQKEGTAVEKMKISNLPKWAQPAFVGMKSLNTVQTQLFETAFNKPEENILLCAPTGAGKTNVAMLTILAELGKHMDDEGEFDLDAFKIVYVAPMKALVQEVVQNFNSRLSSYGIIVSELTGDRNMTKQQIADTQIIVTTPEKWDIVTRKSGDRTYTQLVKLLIIDEVHLLHDERGPVLEALVARTIRQIETSQELIRIVGLSATLPNYKDVATFLRVSQDNGLFYFDNSFRPVPLQQQYIGITEKKHMKRMTLMNEICYEKVIEQAGKNQVLVFTHSRKDTAATAKAIRDMALQQDTLSRFLREDSASREILASEADSAVNQDLKDLMPYGFGIHHAGMQRADRTLVEDLFRDGHMQVLVSTATLAWGVNLPAHTVVIKGTQIYNPEKGKWMELSSLDVMQMMGRAGRPQYDTMGEGIIITSHSELQYYLSLMNQQLPIESQLVSRLADQLNAEVVLGTVQNTKEAINWLGYTYLYVRMLRNPTLYGIDRNDMLDDQLLEQHRADLIHTAANVLHRNNLVKYDRKTGILRTTDLGRVASHYYISHVSIATYNEHLKPNMMDLDIFRLFALSHEFAYITVRDEEKEELRKLLERVPVPVKEGVDEPTAKVNVLLQAYISNLKLDGFALMSDMVYITQSAGRIFRALFEVVLRRRWSSLTEKILDLSKMVEKRMWLSHTPLRQFKGIPPETLKQLERKEFSWERYYDLSPSDLGDLIHNNKVGRNLYKYIHQVPRLDLAAHVQPITRGTLRVELTITPDFQFDEKVHGGAESFWIMVTDVNGENILHYELFVLKMRFAKEEHFVYFTIPVTEPLPPLYYIKVVSDRWLWSEAVLPISFRHLILPEKYPPHTELLDLQPLPISALRNPQFESVYTKFKTFNPIQTQVFHTLYSTDENILVGAPTGSGKTVCMELAILRVFNTFTEKARCVYVAPHEDICNLRYADWKAKFDDTLGRRVVKLTGETQFDLKLLEKGEIIISTPEQWDVISRKWKQRRNVQNVKLFMVDEMHLIVGSRGPVLEVVVSRMRYISSQMEKIRIVAVSSSLANAKDIGEWIGAGPTSIFNFHPSVRPTPLEISIEPFDNPGYQARMLAMYKPTFMALRRHSYDKPALVFVPEKKYTYALAVELVSYCRALEDQTPFLKVPIREIQDHLGLITDDALRTSLGHGIGFYHEGLSEREKLLVFKLFEAGAIQVFITAYKHCWGVDLTAHCVITMGTQYYDGREHRHQDYHITDMLQMMGRAPRPLLDESGKCVVFCYAPKREYYQKFLMNPFPVESHLDHFLADHLNAEIVTKTIESKQDAVDYLTWTFLYRRLKQNPNYYNLQGVSHAHLSDFLSELIENTLQSLEQSRCIAIEEDDSLSPLNLGMIASYYYTQYTTIELFASSLAPRIKLKGLIEILAHAAEYDGLSMRHNEDEKLKKLAFHCTNKLTDPKYTDPHTKANILLQCHFSRRKLTSDLDDDRRWLLSKTLPLIRAMVDVIASNRWLNPALAAMELHQMVVQGLWDKDSPLLQLPHFTPVLAKRCTTKGVESIFDIADLEDDTRKELLDTSEAKMAEVAQVCNRYPNINVDHNIPDIHSITSGSTVLVEVSLGRELEDGQPISKVFAPHFPKEIDEGWWLIIGDPKKNILYAIRRINIGRKLNAKLEFTAPKPGKYSFNLYLMCDCYLGVDQEYALEFEVKEGMDED